MDLTRGALPIGSVVEDNDGRKMNAMSEQSMCHAIGDSAIGDGRSWVGLGLPRISFLCDPTMVLSEVFSWKPNVCCCVY